MDCLLCAIHWYFIFLRNPTEQLSLLLPLYNRHVPAFSVKCYTNIRLYFYIIYLLGGASACHGTSVQDGGQLTGADFSPTHRLLGWIQATGIGSEHLLPLSHFASLHILLQYYLPVSSLSLQKNSKACAWGSS